MRIFNEEYENTNRMGGWLSFFNDLVCVFEEENDKECTIHHLLNVREIVSESSKNKLMSTIMQVQL